MLLVIAPYALADFAVTPTLDVTSSSNLPGATDAVYTFHFENPDKSTGVSALSTVIPAGYSIGPAFITTKQGVTIMKGKAGQVGGMLSAPFTIESTTTLDHYLTTISAMIYTFHADVVLTEPTATAQGKLEFQIPSISLMGNAVFLDASTVPGFFINPSNPGTYTWGPSLAIPIGGASVATVARSGFTQAVTIIGPSATTQTATAAATSTASPATTVATQTPTTTVVTQTPATTAQTIMTQPETTTAQPTGGGLPTETLIGLVVLIVIVAGAAVYVLRRKKPVK